MVKYYLETHNKDKVYVITRYSCGHYHENQTILGKKFYRKSVRVAAKWAKTLIKETFEDGLKVEIKG